MTVVTRSCRVEGCDRPLRSAIHCAMHHNRWKRSGSVGEPHERIIKGDNDARFWTKVEKTDGCWLWIGHLDADGYGNFSLGRSVVRSHRHSYELLVGRIPDGLTLDHLCRVRNCVNPEHLEPVTNAENTRRGTSPAAVNATKSHCKNGHPFDEANTRIRPNGGRECRKCSVIKSMAYQARKKAASWRTS